MQKPRGRAPKAVALGDAITLLEEALRSKARHPWLEKHMLYEAHANLSKYSIWIISYAEHVIGGRWDQAENFFYTKLYIETEQRSEGLFDGNSNAAAAAADYARRVIRGRWRDIEPLLAQSPYDLLRYCVETCFASPQVSTTHATESMRLALDIYKASGLREDFKVLTRQDFFTQLDRSKLTTYPIKPDGSWETEEE